MEPEGDCFFEYKTPEEIKQYREERNKYVQKCKDEGVYGEEYVATIEVEEDPILDNITGSYTSYGFTIINFSEK